MSEAIIVALIAAATSLVGTIVTVLVSNRKTTNELTHKLETHQAVSDTKIDELTREVRSHNNFAQRMPVVEEQIKVINHRISDLESYHKPTN